ncbi:DUF58 domain-containing protein [Euzebya rosea]|uniref:DUF58 domain-containing protein n=1 Tax=Euzebya rosea TaxID=2052804 RepID=UPI000D3E3E8B|nr:DUF58 domain-containing protein [Euzebya rosea]
MGPPRLPTTRPTGLGWFVLGLATLLYVAGANIGSGWLVLLAATLGAAVTVDLVTTRGLSRATACVVDGAGTGTVEAPPHVTVRVTRPPHMGSTLLAVPALGLRSVLRETGTSSVSAAVRRSVGPLDAVDVVVRTVGGLTLAAAEQRSSHEVRCTVVPTLHAGAGRLARIVGGQGPRDRRRVGRDEVRGLREHAAGDGSRLVHWRATARRGQLLVRDTGGTIGPDVRIDLADDAGWSPPGMVLAATVIAGLAAAAEQDGGATVTLGGQRCEWTPAMPELLARQHPLGSGDGRVPPSPALEGGDVAADGPDAIVRPDPEVPTAIVVDTPSDRAVLRSLEEVRAWLAGA